MSRYMTKFPNLDKVKTIYILKRKVEIKLFS